MYYIMVLVPPWAVMLRHGHHYYQLWIYIYIHIHIFITMQYTYIYIRIYICIYMYMYTSTSHLCYGCHHYITWRSTALLRRLGRWRWGRAGAFGPKGPWLDAMPWLNRWIYPRNLLHNYGTSPFKFIVDFPMIFPWKIRWCSIVM